MRKTFLILLFSIVCGTLLAQDTDTLEIEPVKQPWWINARPQFRGTVRAKYEHDLNKNLYRFNIRNARVIVSGIANDWISYQIQADLSDEGAFRILDADVRFQATNNLTLKVGQTFLPFIQPHLITPGEMLFANRALVNRYMSGSARDIGITANYRFPFYIPINLSGALFNGAGTNNPRWTETKDLGYAFRLMFGSMDCCGHGTQFSLKTYQATDRDHIKNELYAIDFRYLRRFLTIEGELLRGNYIGIFDNAGDIEKRERIGCYLQASRIIMTKKQRLSYITPAARWDMMGGANRTDFSDVNRLTLGLNFGFRVLRKTELKLNYEKYWVEKGKAPLYFGADNSFWHDKITLEIVLNF
ncbi:MAG: OprO/OprP family phosphate-selective porin [Bacteroidales bacterium]|nr:OprO/OprP family phosphate-selective porin [Bacteroidales bacterium]